MWAVSDRRTVAPGRSGGRGSSSCDPLLRASGVPYDVRRAEPYSIYDELDFDVPVGENGDIYVGELTGVGALGVSRVWRIEPGTTGAVCPGEDCELAVDDRFTSIINMAFGPDGYLYVVEYDEAGWLTSLGVGTPEGGTVNRCDVEAGTCEVAEIGGESLAGLPFPAAITFDKWGDAWLLENNLLAPTVRKLD